MRFILLSKTFSTCVLGVILLLPILPLHAQDDSEREELRRRRAISTSATMPRSLNTGELPSGSIAVNREAKYQTMSPEELIQEVFVKTGACTTVKNVNVKVYNWTGSGWTGSTTSNRRSPRGLAYFNKANSTFPMKEGLVLSTADVHETEGPNTKDNALYGGISQAYLADPDLQAILDKQGGNHKVTNFTILEFDFIPTGRNMEFKYIFSSEEYPEYVNNIYNDVFGFFVHKVGDEKNKKNIALLPETDTKYYEVSINNVNHGYSKYNNIDYSGTKISNKKFFVKNLKGSPATEMDGYTTVLTAKYENITPCDTYHLKIAIGNAGDMKWGSAVFLEANSFDTGDGVVVFGNGIENMNSIFKTCDENKIRVSIPDISSVETIVNLGYSGTAINGQHYIGLNGQPLPTSVVIPAGQKYVEIPFKATASSQAGMYFDIVLYCPCPGSSVSSSQRVTIYEFAELSSVVTSSVCSNGSNGTITVENTGGSGLYEYSIDNGINWQTNKVFTGLAAGEYTVLSRDVGSCDMKSANAVIGNMSADAGADMVQCGNPIFVMNATQSGLGDVGQWSISGTNPGGVVIENSGSPTTKVTVPEGKSVTLKWTVSNNYCSESSLVNLTSKNGGANYESVYLAIDVNQTQGTTLDLSQYVAKVPESVFTWETVASSVDDCLSANGILDLSRMDDDETHIFKYIASDECQIDVHRYVYVTITGN